MNMAFENYNPVVGPEQSLYAVPLRYFNGALQVKLSDVPERFQIDLTAYRSLLGMDYNNNEYMSWKAFAKYIEAVRLSHIEK